MQKLLTMIGAAAVVAAGAILPMAVLADVDENGLTPYHWYKLDGNTTSSGEAESSIIWRIGSYVESRSGQAADEIGGCAALGGHPQSSIVI